MTTKHWNLNTGKLVSTVKSAEIATSSVDSPCGKYQLLSLEDSTCLFKDQNTGITVKFMRENSKSISSLKISRDGKYLLSGSLDRKAVLIDLHDFKIIKEFQNHDREITSVAINPKRNLIATSALDGKLILNDITSGNKLFEITDQSDIVLSVEFSDCGNQLVAGGRDKTIRLQRLSQDDYGYTSNNLLDVHLVRSFIHHIDWVTSVAISSDNKQVLSGSRDTKACLFNVNLDKLVVEQTGNRDCISTAAFTPDSMLVITSALDGTVNVQNRETGKKLKELFAHSGPILSQSLNIDQYDRNGRRIYYKGTGKEEGKGKNGGGKDIKGELMYDDNINNIEVNINDKYDRDFNEEIDNALEYHNELFSGLIQDDEYRSSQKNENVITDNLKKFVKWIQCKFNNNRIHKIIEQSENQDIKCLWQLNQDDKNKINISNTKNKLDTKNNILSTNTSDLYNASNNTYKTSDKIQELSYSDLLQRQNYQSDVKDPSEIVYQKYNKNKEINKQIESQINNYHYDHQNNQNQDLDEEEAKEDEANKIGYKYYDLYGGSLKIYKNKKQNFNQFNQNQEEYLKD